MTLLDTQDDFQLPHCCPSYAHDATQSFHVMNALSAGTPRELDPPRSTAALDPRSRTALLAWLCLIATPLLITAGHLHSDIPWQRVHISWYAAKAPLGGLITLAMATSTTAILCTARLLPGSLRPRWWSFILAMLLCVGAAGLVTLALYEVDTDRRTHNIGLAFFFFMTTPAMILAGLTAALNRRPWRERMAGLLASVTTLTGIAVYVMWHLIPLERGVRQRVAFTLIWVAALVLLYIVSRPQRCPALSADTKDDGAYQSDTSSSGSEDKLRTSLLP